MKKDIFLMHETIEKLCDIANEQNRLIREMAVLLFQYGNFDYISKVEPIEKQICEIDGETL